MLNGHPERPGSKFKPEWIFSYRPPRSERWRIRGGHSPCGDIEILEPRREIAHIGFCHASFKRPEGRVSALRHRVRCGSDRPPPDASTHLNVGAMDVRSGKTQVWQHQILNAAPPALPAIAAAGANVTILHWHLSRGCQRHRRRRRVDGAGAHPGAEERRSRSRSPGRSRRTWSRISCTHSRRRGRPHPVSASRVLAVPRRARLGGGRTIAAPATRRGLRRRVRGWVAYLTRPVGTEGRSRMRNLANEEEAFAREVLDELARRRLVAATRRLVRDSRRPWASTAAPSQTCTRSSPAPREIIGEEAPTTLRPRWSYASRAREARRATI